MRTALVLALLVLLAPPGAARSQTPDDPPPTPVPPGEDHLPSGWVEQLRALEDSPDRGDVFRRLREDAVSWAAARYPRGDLVRTLDVPWEPTADLVAALPPDSALRFALRLYFAGVGWVGQAPPQSVLALLASEDPDVRVLAAIALGQASWKIPGATAALRRSLDDPVAEVRAASARGLSSLRALPLGWPASICLERFESPFLGFSCGTEGPMWRDRRGVRVQALRAVLLQPRPRLGTSAVAAEELDREILAAVPRLAELLADDSAPVRTAASLALERAGPMAAPHAGEALRRLVVEQPITLNIRIAAAVLGEEALVPDLVAAAEAGSAAALDAVMRLEYLAPEALTLVKFHYFLGRVELAPILLTLGADAVPVFVAGLDSSDEVVLAMSILALGELGPTAAPALPRLRQIREGRVAVGVLLAAEALERIDP
jgi:HEAT repeat protein